MIKIISSKGKSEITASGGMLEICAEIGHAVSSIYRDLKDDDKDAAAEFKKTMQITFADDSPVWGDKDEKSELDDTLEKIIKRMGMRWRRRQ